MFSVPAFMKGWAATHKILKGSVPRFSSPALHVYAKKGGYEQALKDFRALKPKNVKTDVRVNGNTVILFFKSYAIITKTRLYNFEPPENPLLYGKTGVYRGIHYVFLFC